jgi:hypothetical protein
MLLVGDYVRARVISYLKIEKLIRHASLPLARLALGHARCLGGSIPFVDFRGKISRFGRGVQTSAAVFLGFGHPPLPSFVVLAIKFRPALLTRGGWNSILVAGHVVATLIECWQAVEGFEFNGPAKLNETGFNAGHRPFGAPESRSR